MEAFLDAYNASQGTYASVYIGFLRWAVPIVAAFLLLRCAWPLLTFRREPEIWGWLLLPGGKELPITHWESVIGRSRSCDLTVDSPKVSRNHAVLTRYDDGSWTISDAGSKVGLFVNDAPVSICAIDEDDVINIGGIRMRLKPITDRQEQRQLQLRTKASGIFSSIFDLLVLTVLQLMIFFGFLMCAPEDAHLPALQGFGGIILCQWLLLIFYGIIRKTSFEVETLAFLLCTMGMAAIISVRPGEAVKQLAALGIGVLTFLTVGWSLRDLERAKVFRYLATVAGVGFLVVTLLFGTEYYGAKNWLVLGGISLQPSELTKVCFVFAGASTMDRLMNKRNLIGFIAYSVLICGCLALMNDFGTALIFFSSFLVIAYLRSGSMGTVALAITALIFAGVIGFKIAPHALKRFSAWRHIWEDPFGAGYQQTQALISVAAGGLLGLGPDQGRLQKIFAADSDIVFATVSEEWGLITALLVVLCVIVWGLFAIRTAKVARSSFYAIGGCTAASILVIQTILNCLGTLDVLPFTGVTFPMLSNGGTSMIGAWGLLAFVKASDTRQNASFAVRAGKYGRDKDE